MLRLIGTIQVIQLFARLAYEEKLLPEQHFFAWSDRIQELSRMAVGWLSSSRPPRPGQAISAKTGGVQTYSSPRDGSRS